MTAYEYKLVPAPVRAERIRGIKDPAERFALTVEQAVNRMAAQGWEFLRTETLPEQERRTLGTSRTETRVLLVFRRERQDDLEAFRPRPLEETERSPAAGAGALSRLAGAARAGVVPPAPRGGGGGQEPRLRGGREAGAGAGRPADEGGEDRG